MTDMQQTISPVDGSLYVERAFAEPSVVDATLTCAVAAQRGWAQTSIAERAAICTRFTEALLRHADEIALEITWQIGRPISQTPNEVKGCVERARFMIAAAEDALAPLDPGPKEGFKRYVTREPLGVVYVIAPWNYPLLTAVNTVVPAIMAGNAVVLKHAPQTPLAAERFQQAFDEAGLPPGVFQHLHLTNQSAEALIREKRVNHVAFTGSVATGHAVSRAAADRFITVGLELGGKDPAYVRADADIAHAVENLVDGAFFNSGQSCCGIERIYLHASIHDEFIERAVALTKQYKLGNPTDQSVNLGPVVSTKAAAFIRGQIDEAIAQGAQPLIEETLFAASAKATPYIAPQILTNVSHDMRVMYEETFGPVIGIIKVNNDAEAVTLMNDSLYGLTAALFSKDLDAVTKFSEQLNTGTIYMNRCDALDPALPWVGTKDSGRGFTLSSWGYEQLTKPKSHHFRIFT